MRTLLAPSQALPSMPHAPTASSSPSRCLVSRVALLVAGLPLWAACGDREGIPRSDLAVLYTSTVQGFIEPCGCSVGQIGGIDRIASYVEDELAAHPDSLFVDLGDLFARHTRPDPAFAQQLPFKAHAFFRVWGDLGCEAMALGETDLILGVDLLRELSEQYGVPILCGNLVDESGEAPFPSSVVVERDGKRIGIFSLLAPHLTETEVEEPREINVRAIARDQGYKITPWRLAARRIVEELSADCDMILFASHLGYRNNRAVAKEEPAIDVIFGGHWDDSKQETNWVGRTPVLVGLAKGSRVGRIEWWWDDEDAYFESPGPGELADVSPHVLMPMNELVERANLRDLAGRAGAFGTKDWEDRQQAHRAAIAEYAAERERLGPFPGGANLFSHVLVPLDPGQRRSEDALRAIDDYHQRANAYWTGQRNPPGPPSELYVGPATCLPCHPLQHEFWLATRHSRALASLRATLQDTDPECFGCHTVGYRQKDGFTRPDQIPPFANVQCAACHGPGGFHVAGGASFLMPDNIHGEGIGGCAACHEKEHDPDFEKEAVEKLVAVACPPMEPAGGGTPALRESYVQAAMALELFSEGPVPWRLVTHAYQMAGDVPRYVNAAERWVERNPNDFTSRLTLAQSYLEAGRAAEAAPILRQLVEGNPTSAEAWLGLGDAVLATDPEEAIRCAREAFSLSPMNLDALRILVRGQKGAGRPDEARASLDLFLQEAPQARGELAELIAEIGTAER